MKKYLHINANGIYDKYLAVEACEMNKHTMYVKDPMGGILMMPIEQFEKEYREIKDEPRY